MLSSDNIPTMSCACDDGETSIAPNTPVFDDEREQEKKEEMKKIAEDFMKHMHLTQQKENQQQLFYEQLKSTLNHIQQSIADVKTCVDQNTEKVNENKRLKQRNTELEYQLFSMKCWWNAYRITIGVCVFAYIMYLCFPETITSSIMYFYPFRRSSLVTNSVEPDYTDELFDNIFSSTPEHKSYLHLSKTTSGLYTMHPAKMISNLLSWMME